MSKPPTQEQRTDASRLRLIEAAINSLAEEGYNGSTVLKIQAESGLSRGLISYHFGSKENLFEACIDFIRDRHNREVGNLGSTTSCGLDECVELMDGLLQRLEEDPTAAKVMLVLATESVGRHPGVRDAVRRRHAELHTQLEAGIERGKRDGSISKDVDVGAQATAIQAIFRGVSVQYLVAPEAFKMKNVREEVRIMITQSLRR